MNELKTQLLTAAIDSFTLSILLAFIGIALFNGGNFGLFMVIFFFLSFSHAYNGVLQFQLWKKK